MCRCTIVLRASVSVQANQGVVFIPFHFAEAVANLLTIEVLDPLAKIPEYKACAVRVVKARVEELPVASDRVVRGRY